MSINSLHLWTAHFHLLIHEYNHHFREAGACRDRDDQGELT